MSQSFISYSRRDREIVDSIVEKLEAAGMGIWIDREDIKAGKTWRVQIVEAIATCDAFVLMLSSNSAASDNVRREVDLAQDAGRAVFIIKLDPVKLPAEMLYQLVGLQHIELQQLGVDKAVQRLTDTLEEHLATWRPHDDRAVRQVELVFQAGTRAEFGAKKRAETLGLISALTETPQSRLDITTLEAGGVHVFVDMPAAAAFELKTRALNRDRRLKQFGIKSLRIVGDKQYVNTSLGILTPTATIGTLTMLWSSMPSLFPSLFGVAVGKVIVITTVVVITTAVGIALADGLGSDLNQAPPTPSAMNPPGHNSPSPTSEGTMISTSTLAESSTSTSTLAPTIPPVSTPLRTRTIAPPPSPTRSSSSTPSTPVPPPAPTLPTFTAAAVPPAIPTDTSSPTATHTPIPSNTPTPTDTPSPTDTPTPSITLSPTPNVYGVDVLTDNLWLVDKTNGAGQSVGQIGFDQILGLSCSQNPGKLYAVDSPLNGNSILLEVDIQTGLATLIGDIGFDSVTGLAFDNQNGILYAITYLDEFLTIDTNTGQGTLVAHPGSTFLDSLAYDPQQQTLFAVNINTGDLYRIDLPGGMGQLVGATGFINISGLAYDPTTDTLYGAARASGELVMLDVNTGAGTRVGSMPNTAFNALASCPGN